MHSHYLPTLQPAGLVARKTARLMAIPLQLKHVEAKLGKALETVKQLLHAERVPQLAGHVHHQYDDKYILVERATCLAAASQLSCLGALGLTNEHLQTMRRWGAAGSSVSLRFKSKEACSFAREETREEEDPRKHVEETSIGGVLRSTVTSKVVTKITEYFWKFEANYVLEALCGVGSDSADRLVLLSHTGAVELKTTTKAPAPYPEARVPAINQEVNITWLINTLNEDEVAPQFQINRTVPGCKTPRRNPETDRATEHFNSFAYWTQYVTEYFHHLRTVQPRKPDESAFSAESVFVPVLPLMFDSNVESAEPEEPPSGLFAVLRSSPSQPAQGPVLSVGDGNRFLAEELRCLKEHRNNASLAFPGDDGLIRAVEIHAVVTLLHCRNVCDMWKRSLDYVEGMLRQQLVAAIGKEIGAADFAAYMQFHYRKLFLEQYQPKQFCFSVRRSEKHSPEGTVSIDEEAIGLVDGGSIRSPIVAISQCSSRPVSMSFDLSASTTVTFSGPVHLHGWLSHSFSGQSGSNLFLTSRARQFSSMVVLVGRVTSATTFDPTYAAIVQNKDELTIPLELSVIPTPKEFKDAIASLSPSQQAFAKAFRAMQLESTLFGVAVVQIKPQLEKLLNLAEDSLTKEIKLTQDLLELFLKYQIPSDLLSFDGGADSASSGTFAPPARPAERVAAVRGHVKAMFDMIDEEKRREIEERRREEEYLRPQLMEIRCEEAVMERATCAFDDFQEEKKEFAKEGLEKKVKMKRAKAAKQKEARASANEVVLEMTEDSVSRPQDEPSGSQAPKEGNEQPQETQGAAATNDGATRDFTQVPQELDERFEKLDPDSALRPTIITPGSLWSKRAQKSLLSPPSTSSLSTDDQKREKDAAFDLLDAITKSGALELSDATLHIVIAATHCFTKTVTDCAVQDNVNPIERVERSALIMASTIHQQPVKELVNQSNVPRLSAASPEMFLEDGHCAELLRKPCRASPRDQEGLLATLALAASDWHADVRKPSLTPPRAEAILVGQQSLLWLPKPVKELQKLQHASRSGSVSWGRAAWGENSAWDWYTPKYNSGTSDDAGTGGAKNETHPGAASVPFWSREGAAARAAARKQNRQARAIEVEDEPPDETSLSQAAVEHYSVRTKAEPLPLAASWFVGTSGPAAIREVSQCHMSTSRMQKYCSTQQQ
ncbi:unnamed protein product [Symbiodinium sp. CCMP2592]|nr:unnamed protein product [Symbiodinium sp. CCMP2592]